LPLDPVLQRADLFDFEFDGIAVLEIPAEFEAAAVADGAGSNELAGRRGPSQRQSMLARRPALDVIGDLARRNGWDALSGTADDGTLVPNRCGPR
jgi:hypothetical protein